ncbi:MAG: hypothetical protein RJQ14_19820 [Marinoscillum sp.]
MKQQPTLFLSFHVESDAFYTNHDNFDSFKGFENALDFVQNTCDSAGQEVPVLWQFRCDPQMDSYFGNPSYLFDKYHEKISMLRKKADELGIHVHPFRNSGDAEVQDFDDKQWMNHCIEVSIKAFKNSMGYLPKSISIGHGATYLEVVNFCRKQGLQFDFSLEYPVNIEFPTNNGKFLGRREPGAIVKKSYYCPSEVDLFKSSSKKDYFMIPISRTAVAYRISFLKKVKRVVKRQPLKRLIKLSLALHPEEFRLVINRQLRRKEIIVVDTRTHVFRDPKKYRNAEENLRFLLSINKEKILIDTPVKYFENKLKANGISEN